MFLPESLSWLPSMLVSWKFKPNKPVPSQACDQRVFFLSQKQRESRTITLTWQVRKLMWDSAYYRVCLSYTYILELRKQPKEWFMARDSKFQVKCCMKYSKVSVLAQTAYILQLWGELFFMNLESYPVNGLFISEFKFLPLQVSTVKVCASFSFLTSPATVEAISHPHYSCYFDKSVWMYYLHSHPDPCFLSVFESIQW